MAAFLFSTLLCCFLAGYWYGWHGLLLTWFLMGWCSALVRMRTHS